MTKELNGMKVAILVTDFFEEAELTEPRKALREAGAEALVVSPKPGKVQGVKHEKPAEAVAVDLTLDQARPDDFDAALLPGGALNADALRVEPKAQEFVRRMEAEGKPIAVICHGGWLLASAGLVKGKRMTSYHTIHDDMKNAGARWEDAEVVVDGTWVSSRKPDDIPAFNREMLRVFGEHAPAEPATRRREEEVRR